MDAGHLLGSASIKMSLTENDTKKTVIFSGDIGNINKPIIKDPCFLDGADYVLIESTYGDRFHGEAPDYVGELARIRMKLLQEVEMLLFIHLQLVEHRKCFSL